MTTDEKRHRNRATSAALKRRAEARRCPRCQRGNALVRVRLGALVVGCVCRYRDCRYERTTP